MGWESRGGRRYYYAARRVGGRVVKAYIGPGEVGALAAALEAESRRRRADHREGLRLERARVEPADRALDELERACVRAIETALVDAGYHKSYSKWRRKRARIDDPLRAGVAGQR
jgi:hypothetical protein